MRRIYLIVFFSLLANYYANCQESLKRGQCYATWQQDTLVVGNETIQVKFAKSAGGLNILSFQNTLLCEKLDFNGNSSVFSLGDLTNSSELTSYKARFIPGNPSEEGHLLVELINAYPTLDIKRQIVVYPDCPMIRLDYALKSKSGKFSFTNDDGSLLNVSAKGNHWKMKAIEFYDRTDKKNTLVKEHDLLSFRYPEKLSGNILFANDLKEKTTLVILKEAPCSFVQQEYPGYDFRCLYGDISVCGTGIANDGISSSVWTETYSVAIGVSGGNELEKLSTLRSYQDKMRRTIPERDDMIMMNTWGDRNQDASINESFVKNEIDACRKLNINLLQVDDGWQQGRSHNSADKGGLLWDKWEKADWQPDSAKFPNGFGEVVEYAKENGVKLGLWFHPTNENYYATWKRDAQIILDLYKTYDVRYFKIDGVKLPNNLAVSNFRKFLDTVAVASDYHVVFNLDLTADNRGGYNFFYEYGNMFLENRYTDWGNYYPYWTLRNVWMLSEYIPAQKLQIEFLNPSRNSRAYPPGDIYAPLKIPFDFQFAITMAGQPLAWFEGSQLPEKYFSLSPLIGQYVKVQSDFHQGQIFPIGDEPSGSSWTGFQSILNGRSGYFLVYRENNDTAKKNMKTYLQPGVTVRLKKIAGYGTGSSQKTNEDGAITFALPGINQFALYRYFIE